MRELEEVNKDAFNVKTSVCGENELFLKLDNFLACKGCKQVYYFDSKYGTSTMKKHPCQTTQEENQPRITQHMSKELKKADQLPFKVLQLIRDTEMKFIVNRMRPFNTTKNKDFIEFVQIISEMSHKYGKLDESSVLHSTKALTEDVARKAKTIVNDLKPKILQAYGKKL